MILRLVIKEMNNNKIIIPILNKEQVKRLLNIKPNKDIIESCKKAGKLFGEPK